jgi:hypothetical protein
LVHWCDRSHSHQPPSAFRDEGRVATCKPGTSSKAAPNKGKMAQKAPAADLYVLHRRIKGMRSAKHVERRGFRRWNRSGPRALPCQGSSGQQLTDIGAENKRVMRRRFGPQMDLKPSLDLTRTSHTRTGNGTTFALTRAVVSGFFNVVALRQQLILPIRTVIQRAPGSQSCGCHVK